MDYTWKKHVKMTWISDVYKLGSDKVTEGTLMEGK